MKAYTGNILFLAENFAERVNFMMFFANNEFEKALAESIKKIVKEIWDNDKNFVEINEKEYLIIPFKVFKKFLELGAVLNMTITNFEDIILEEKETVVLGPNESIEVGISTGPDRSIVNLSEKNGKITINSGCTILGGTNTSELTESFLPCIKIYYEQKNIFFDEKTNTLTIKENGKKTKKYALSYQAAQLRMYENLIEKYIIELMISNETVIDIYESIILNELDEEKECRLDALTTAYYYLEQNGYDDGETLIKYPKIDHEIIKERIAKLKLQR